MKVFNKVGVISQSWVFNRLNSGIRICLLNGQLKGRIWFSHSFWIWKFDQFLMIHDFISYEIKFSISLDFFNCVWGRLYARLFDYKIQLINIAHWTNLKLQLFYLDHSKKTELFSLWRKFKKFREFDLVKKSQNVCQTTHLKAWE